MPGLRSLRNRLAVIFALIMLGAIGTIYLSVSRGWRTGARQQLNGLAPTPRTRRRDLRAAALDDREAGRARRDAARAPRCRGALERRDARLRRRSRRRRPVR